MLIFRHIYCRPTIFLYIFFIAFVMNADLFMPCKSFAKTKVTIQNDVWLINDQVVNKNSPSEGLLMNVRMVNAVFEDTGPEGKKYLGEFNAEDNVTNFINMMPAFVANGINAFTISLQGGYPGYEGAVNSAFNSDGSLRQGYLERVSKVIKVADINGAVIILSCFYQRQHSHQRTLDNRQAILNAVANVVNWIKEQSFTNVVLEVSNEYAHEGFSEWNKGSLLHNLGEKFSLWSKEEWLRSVDGQVELIQHAKSIKPDLLVSTSGMGDGMMPEQIALAADFILLHFNNTKLKNIPEKIKMARTYGKPVVCNEDDKVGKDGAEAARLSVKHGAGWGFMHSDKNQYAPFEFDGYYDDSIVYQKFKDLTSPR